MQQQPPVPQQQSPINLRNPIFVDPGPNLLKVEWKRSAVGHVKVEDGVRIEFDFDERQFVLLGRKKFHLRQFHFHHPSEHAVNGRQRTAELHVVHQNMDDGTRAVVGIFVEPAGGKAATPQLMADLKALLGGGQEGGTTPRVSTNPLDFLPDNPDKYYRYEGSLTTPPFDENVSWAVLRDPLLVPKADLNDLIVHFRHPARFPQPLYRRFLLATFRE